MKGFVINWLCCASFFLLSACSENEPLTSTINGTAHSDQTLNALLADETQSILHREGLLSSVPSIVVGVTQADSGIHIGYTDASQQQLVSAQQIEYHWLSMQQCLNVSGVAPIFVVTQDFVDPLTLEDDVIFSIEGFPIASATFTATPIVLIYEWDFWLDRRSPGFNLRSIIGRLLWLSASLPERDYPFACAREQQAP